jgi:hypothetical protein
LFVNSRGAHTKMRPTSRVETWKYRRSRPLETRNCEVKTSDKEKTQKDTSRDASHFWTHQNRMANVGKVNLPVAKIIQRRW